jgi:hypothetical protein
LFLANCVCVPLGGWGRFNLDIASIFGHFEGLLRASRVSWHDLALYFLFFLRIHSFIHELPHILLVLRLILGFATFDPLCPLVGTGHNIITPLLHIHSSIILGLVFHRNISLPPSQQQRRTAISVCPGSSDSGFHVANKNGYFITSYSTITTLVSWMDLVLLNDVVSTLAAI